MIAPGSTIGILGGGQLGRMLAMAAASMGYRVHIFAPEAELPAGDVSAAVTRAAYTDRAALAAFAAAVDVVTVEFENVDAASLEFLGSRVPTRPGARALRVAQDRLAEKDFFTGLGGRVAPYLSVSSPAELEAAVREIGTPGILKTRRFGYDGKGQIRIDSDTSLDAAWTEIGENPSVYEGFVRFDAEFSILLARAEDGSSVVYPAPRNTHESGILALSEVPAPAALAEHIEDAAAMARKVADALSYVGLITLEFFACADGPVFNEMAPRVHNSGHWTIEGAHTSQFENHIRAICGLPLGETGLSARSVRMKNLIGEDANDWAAILADPRAHLHLYGKSEVKPGRKMGHVTWLED
ncbi:5-(carboxyamino)imidazole ribonucleotide synthase [Sphingosinicella microcystinivorans]|uniref:N5-carboxyaminoimidazole ribonucleotide synthase n=1 Tax=Sphingosinicella microcystinivorans TaxID=335406 RepID=A0AAD1DBU9_SPHMI|nr:5-(carboxyamino)imidazole ribonucleotide synthase [Sphingosinicella microcystinivorans]RKS88085.1 5-(carboxyamino)imidazole ribonucleotide synthase [Sphingosinicella microcystinivorans]BBE35896.1 N5-carboxyaminoimidazole ribonucleotide synthase [Sphingosinicella microcystinivorans]